MTTTYRIEEKGLAYKSQPSHEWNDQQIALWHAIRAQHAAWMEFEHAKAHGVPLQEECIDAAWLLYHQVEEFARPYFAQEE